MSRSSSQSAAQDGLDIHERETLPPPTIPEPRKSHMRLRIARGFAAVDIVLADTGRDPRSEDHDAARADQPSRKRTWLFRAREANGWPV